MDTNVEWQLEDGKLSVQLIRDAGIQGYHSGLTHEQYHIPQGTVCKVRGVIQGKPYFVIQHLGKLFPLGASWKDVIHPDACLFLNQISYRVGWHEYQKTLYCTTKDTFIAIHSGTRDIHYCPICGNELKI